MFENHKPVSINNISFELHITFFFFFFIIFDDINYKTQDIIDKCLLIIICQTQSQLNSITNIYNMNI